MNKKFLKRVVAFAVAATMVLGNGIIALADEEAGGTATGQTSYEGEAPKAEYITVTLPVAAQDQFDFIADPNSLIRKFASGGAGYTTMPNESDDSLVYFVTGSTVNNQSEPITVINKNAVDIKVSAEVAVTDAGENPPIFSSRGAWTSNITAKELYLALRDETDTSKTAYIGEGGTAAKLNVYVSGNPDQFETGFSTKQSATAAYGEKHNYFVTAKAGVLASNDGWVTGGFHLYGAINKYAEWGKSLSTPELQVTWSISEYKGYEDAYGNWSDGKLWVAKSSSEGFESNALTVEVSDGGKTWNALGAGKFDNNNGWVSITWANIVEAIGSDPTGTVFVRVTDGSVKYVFENK